MPGNGCDLYWNSVTSSLYKIKRDFRGSKGFFEEVSTQEGVLECSLSSMWIANNSSERLENFSGGKIFLWLDVLWVAENS